MAAFAVPKVLTMVLDPYKQFDTYQIPAGTKLFKSYRKQLSQWTPDQVFPVTGQAYFGFDEPNVSENYGFAFAYKTTQPYELLAIDRQKTLAYLWNLAEGAEGAKGAEGAEESEKVQKTLQFCFGFDPNNLKKPQIRTSDEALDYILVDFLCKNGFQGYAGDYIATLRGGKFHPECVICGGRINVELNSEYNVAGIPGLASPTEKHREIGTMLSNRMLAKTKNDKRYSKLAVDENEEPNQKVDLSSVKISMFTDFGGALRKKRTQKRHSWTSRRSWTYRRKQTRSQKKNKSRK